MFNLPAGAMSPMLTLDDKREQMSGSSDALLFYLLSGNLCYRQQRERFTVERNLSDATQGATRIRRVGMSSKLRMQVELDARSQAVHTVLEDDTLYFAHGTNIVPLFRGSDTLNGRWRSPRIRYSDYPAFSWLRVLGDFAHSVVVNLYGDGVLWCSLDVTSKEPVRLPPGRFRSMEVEVVSLGEVPAVALASSAAELKAIKGAA